MKYMVIGGAGYIGSHFIYKAIEEGHDCLAYDNLSTGHQEAIHKQCRFLEGDLHNKGLLAETIATFQPDAIFHFAAFALVGESVENPQKYYHNNVQGVQTLLDVVKDCRPEAAVIFSSTCAVFGVPDQLPITETIEKRPISPYGRSKLMAEYLLEDYAKAYGLKCMALRYFNACGAHPSGQIGEDHDPETHLIPNVIKSALGEKPLFINGKDFPTKDGTCVRDYIHVEDLAVGHILAASYLLKSEAGIFDAVHLGTGNGYSNLEILQEVESVIGKKIDYEFADRREGDPPALYSGVEKAKSLLGFSPEHSDLKNIIVTALRWHQRPQG